MFKTMKFHEFKNRSCCKNFQLILHRKPYPYAKNKYRNRYNIIEIRKISIHVNFLHPFFLSNFKAKKLLLKCWHEISLNTKKYRNEFIACCYFLTIARESFFSSPFPNYYSETEMFCWEKNREKWKKICRTPISDFGLS